MNRKMTHNLLFVHIPRTAGTSFKNYLQSFYTADEISGNWAGGAPVEFETLRQYRCFYGHCIYDLHKLLPQPIDLITFLRNPVERTISTFECIERNETHGGHAILHREASTLSQFIHHPRFHFDASNYQTRVLGMVLSEEDADLLCSEDAAVEKKGEVWRRFWNEELEKVTEDTLRIAKERLSTMFHFGITEAFGQSIEMFAFKMGVAIVGEELRRERAPDTQREKRESRYAIEDIELIQYENKYDIELFNYAKQLFYERYGEFLESKAKGGTVPVVRTRLTQTMLESRFETAGGWRGFRQSKQGMRTFGFLWEVSNRCCNDSIVLDISAGKCLYKSFFEHAQYVAFDSPVDNPNVGNSRMDLHGDAHQLPIREESIDLCVNLAGLERYKNPYALFQEIARILKPGGWLFLHVSFATAEHGTPNDFFRYTRYALAEFCTQNGLRVAFILPTNGLFQTTLNLLEYSLSTLDESMRNPLTALVNQAIKPLFQKLDDVDGVAQEYPKSCRMLQIPSAYCLGALKPGRHTVSDLSITKRDLLEKITACPICQGELEWRSEEILCKACNKVYPIRSGIPYFILD